MNNGSSPSSLSSAVEAVEGREGGLELSEQQRKVQRFIRAALQIGNGYGEDALSDPTLPEEEMNYRLNPTWPNEVDALVKWREKKMILLSDNGTWKTDSYQSQLYVGRFRPNERNGVTALDQLLILLAIAEGFEVLDDEILANINEKITASAAQIVVGVPKIRKTRLAIKSDGSAIAAWVGDGWYGPNGEPVRVDTAREEWMEART